MLIPDRLTPGDEVRIVAPSRSLAMIDDTVRALAEQRLTSLGVRVTFGEYVEKVDEFVSSSIEHRVADLHRAFADPAVRAIISVIGGYNANQLLPYLDWELIRQNPKILCGYSDITALSCAIYAKAGLVTYSGPHFSTFGMEAHLDQTMAWFRAALFEGGRQSFVPAETWTDDAWYLDQQDRTIEPNEGHWVMRPGAADGPLIGGNLCTLNLLQGTEYMPDLAGSIVFIEDDFESMPHTFDRDLTSLVQQPGFDAVVGVLIGRFQRTAGMTRSTLAAIVGSKRELDGVPIVANVDFGHTDPIMTIPVGGAAQLRAGDPEDPTQLALTIDY